MSGDTKPCRICGKQFVPCLTYIPGGFNWRTVACSPECGQKYLAKILESRAKAAEEVEEKIVVENHDGNIDTVEIDADNTEASFVSAKTRRASKKKK